MVAHMGTQAEACACSDYENVEVWQYAILQRGYVLIFICRGDRPVALTVGEETVVGAALAAMHGPAG